MRGDSNLGNEYHFQKLCLLLVSEVLRTKVMILDHSELNAVHRLAATIARLEKSELERCSNVKKLIIFTCLAVPSGRQWQFQ